MSSTSYRISESQIEVPNFLIKKQNRSKTIAKAYFFFWSLRGRGKSSAMISLVKQEHFPILFFFRNLKMRLRHASFKNFHKKSTSKYMNRKKPYQKNGVFWKFWKINDDVKATQSIFLGMNFGGAAGSFDAPSHTHFEIPEFLFHLFMRCVYTFIWCSRCIFSENLRQKWAKYDAGRLLLLGTAGWAG